MQQGRGAALALLRSERRAGNSIRCLSSLILIVLMWSCSRHRSSQVREEYAHAISYLIAELKATGLYNEMREEYRNVFLPERSSCKDMIEYDGACENTSLVLSCLVLSCLVLSGRSSSVYNINSLININ
eukprot:COSAG06_NODE_5116_length_3711_cov_2.390642_5_plen_129_part_00